ncbi:MAG TPA: DddA-like double-stranded DNA deaminase toxin [Pseudonocardiaceae bacterium]
MSQGLIQRLIGRVVLVALVVFGVWFAISHYNGVSRFGCQASGHVVAGVAYADGEHCPATVDEASADAQWAADRLATITRTGSMTTGLFYDEDGIERTFTSQQDGDSNTALWVGRQAAVFPNRGRPVVADHVEVKVAAGMRLRGVSTGVLVINNSSGPCARNADEAVQPLSCLAIVPKMLPAGTTLVVWWPQPGGPPMSKTFVGGQQ